MHPDNSARASRESQPCSKPFFNPHPKTNWRHSVTSPGRSEQACIVRRRKKCRGRRRPCRYRRRSVLAERGFEVTLFDEIPTLAVKSARGCRFRGRYADQSRSRFHAFFRHYYNLRHSWKKSARTYASRTIDEYLVLARDGQKLFQEVATTPVLNILSLGKNKFTDCRCVAQSAKLENGASSGYDKRRPSLNMTA